MLIENYTKGNYLVLKVMEDLTINHNPSTLKQIVAEYITQGKTHIAFSFTPKTFFTSRLISVITACSQMLKENKGKLAIIITHENMLETLNILNMVHNNLFITVENEDLLPSL